MLLQLNLYIVSRKKMLQQLKQSHMFF